MRARSRRLLSDISIERLMTPIQLLHTLQLVDSFFPVGAFAYSDGLETAAAAGRIHDGSSLNDWIDHYLNNVFVPCDGLALLQCAEAMQRGDVVRIQSIDEELTAIKPSAAMRKASRSVGRRMLATYSGICGDSGFAVFANTLLHANAPVAYAAVLTHRGIESRDAVLVFGYTRLAGMVSAALRLIALGQQQAQELLADGLEKLPAAVEHIASMRTDALRSFGPFMDIEQMNHRYVYSKLFRS